MANDSPTDHKESPGLSSRSDGNILRPELAGADGINVLDDALFDVLERALRRAEDDPEVRVVMLSGRGKMFCAGAKLQHDASTMMPDGYTRSAPYRAVLRLLGFSKPNRGRRSRRGDRRRRHAVDALRFRRRRRGNAIPASLCPAGHSLRAGFRLSVADERGHAPGPPS